MKTDIRQAERLYSITEAAKITGFTAETLRFYEREGILSGVLRQDGRRRFSEANLREIQILTYMKKTGMSLKEIKQYFALFRQGERTFVKRLALLREHEKEVQRQMRELERSAAHLAFKIWYYETSLKEGALSFDDREALIARYCRETGRIYSM